MSLPADWSTAVILSIAAVGLATITQAVLPTKLQMGPLSCGYCLCVWYGIAAGFVAGMAGYPAIMCATTPCLAAVVALLLIRYMPEAFSG
jgi:hypothetical protein